MSSKTTDNLRRTAMPTPTTQLDPARIEAFAGELFGFYTGGMLAYMVDIGQRTGLFDAAAEGAASSKGLAVRAGLEERYVREWLGAMTTAHIFEYDAGSGVFE